MYGKLVVLAGGAALLVACDSIPSLGCDSGANCDSGGPVDTDLAGALLIMDFGGTCTGTPDNATWTYWAETNGWTSDGVLYISQDTDPAWVESHDILSVDFEADGSRDYLELELDDVATINEQISGETTLFDCDAGRLATMAWRIDIYSYDDPSGNFVDCVVWGDENAIYGGAEPLDASEDCFNGNGS